MLSKELSPNPGNLETSSNADYDSVMALLKTIEENIGKISGSEELEAAELAQVVDQMAQIVAAVNYRKEALRFILNTRLIEMFTQKFAEGMEVEFVTDRKAITIPDDDIATISPGTYTVISGSYKKGLPLFEAVVQDRHDGSKTYRVIIGFEDLL